MSSPSIPTWFEEALERDFHGELRIRWSARRNEYHIEQRVGRALADPPRWVDPLSDRATRARDGYRFFGAVQPRATRPCPECRFPMDCPILKWAEVQCTYCGFKGLSGRLVLAYFPIGEKLLEHLRQHDPTKDHVRKAMAEMDLHNARVELERERVFEEQRHEALYDYAYSQLPSVGYTGREKAIQ